MPIQHELKLEQNLELESPSEQVLESTPESD
jgi:hypothetical protein